MEVNVGRLAATKQTWRDKTVRELFAEIKREYPKASEEALRRQFRDAVRSDEDYFLAIVDYAFDAANRAFSLAEERRSMRNPTSASERAERLERRACEAAAHAKEVAYAKERIILLNQELPNGKRARYCTLDYMWRLGGAYRHVGKKGSSKLVGETYSEEQYRIKLASLT